MRKGDATTPFAAMLALLVGGLVLVQELEDLIVGVWDRAGSHDGVAVDLFFSSFCGLLLRQWKNSAARYQLWDLVAAAWYSAKLFVLSIM